MFRKVLLQVVTAIVLVVSLALAPVLPALAEGPWTVATAATGSTSPLGDVSNAERELAQTFRAPGTGIVNAFKVTFGANNGSPSGVVTWKLCADYLGMPGFVLATDTFTPTASADNTITLTNGPTLTINGTYWLVFLAADQSTNVSWTMVVSTTSTYADGIRYISADREVSWTAQAGDQQLWLTINGVSATSTPSATPTPANTATPTATYTPTATNTPDAFIVATFALLPGYPIAVKPTATMGSVANSGLLAVLIGAVVIFYVSWILRRR